MSNTVSDKYILKQFVKHAGWKTVENCQS